MEIYLIRHTTPKIEKGICYGQADIPLAETFHIDIQKTLSLLPNGIDIIYSSPLTRCLQLAESIKSNQKIIKDKRLLEMNFGDWEMKKWEEINQQQLSKWMGDFVNEKIPAGECFQDLHQRVKYFFDELILHNFNKNNSLAIIAHAGVIRSILCQVLEIPLRNAFKIPIDYGSLTKIDVDNKTFYKNVWFINQSK